MCGARRHSRTDAGAYPTSAETNPLYCADYAADPVNVVQPRDQRRLDTWTHFDSDRQPVHPGAAGDATGSLQRCGQLDVDIVGVLE